MAQVLRSREARCGIEILRTESAVVMAVLDADCSIALTSHPMEWAEVGQQYVGGRKFFQFDDEWRPLFRYGPTGVEPYPVVEATRKFIRGCFSEPSGFKGGALDALIEVLPQGEVHLFVRGVGFIGRFSSAEDAAMIAGAMKVDRPIIFASPEEFLKLSDLDQVEVMSAIDPELLNTLPTKLSDKHAWEIFEMAKKQTKKKAAKVAKAEATQRRADGPVAKAWEIFEKHLKNGEDKMNSADIIAECEQAGINRGTATTQLGRWRKEKGITVKRGGARQKKDAKSADNKKDQSKASGKKGKKKKAAAKKEPGLPKSKTKGEKRHKPAPNATTGKSSATPPASVPSSEKQQSSTSQTHSSPDKSASVSGAAASGGAAASTSTAAGSPGTAEKGQTPQTPASKS